MMSPSQKEHFVLSREGRKKLAVERLNDHIIGARIEDGVTVYILKRVYAWGAEPQKSAQDRGRA